jgi:hypothetical protein
MTEIEWENCTDPLIMLPHLQGKANRRKLRLFICAWCRKRWKYLTDERSQKAVALGEQFADGMVSEQELRNALHQAAVPRNLALSDWQSALLEKRREGPCLPTMQSRIDRGWLSYEATQAAMHCVGLRGCYFGACQIASGKNKAEKCPWLRHIFGNPFRPPVPLADLSLTVIQLAMAVYQRQDCGFALNDALLENGRPELADHFRREKWHPKGCWAVDLILGK